MWFEVNLNLLIPKYIYFAKLCYEAMLQITQCKAKAVTERSRNV